MSESKEHTSAPESETSRSLEAAVAGLKESSDALAGFAHRPAAEDSTEQASSIEHDEEDQQELYYQHLSARGALKDVDEDVDLNLLPPTVTHVRFPDGRVQRIGYD